MGEENKVEQRTPPAYVERIRLDLFQSLWAVVVQGARLVRLRYHLPDSGKTRNMPCPCGSGKKFKRCHGR